MIIDPMFSFTGGKNLNAESDSRPIARKLIAISQKYSCAVAGVRHIGKSKGNGDPRNAGLGSIAWRASARSVLLVGDDPSTGERAICQTKANLAAECKISVGYKIVNGMFAWDSIPSRLTKERMLAASLSPDDKADHEEAKHFLQTILSEGGRPSIEVLKEAMSIGISKYAFNKAKHALGVRSEKRGGHFGGENKWYLCPEGIRKTAEEIDNKSRRILQVNGADKINYKNGLAEEFDAPASRTLQAVPAEDSNAEPYTDTWCDCEALGVACIHCPDCGGSAEESDTDDCRILQVNGAHKTNYENGLAEEFDAPARRTLEAAPAKGSDAEPYARTRCECGEYGIAGRACRDCGELIEPVN